MPDTEMVDPTTIDTSLHNPRLVFDPEDLARLRESIDEVGILVPLTVYRGQDERLKLIDGERRLTCALELGLDGVPVYIVEDVDETEELKWMFSIHMLREQWEDGPVAKALRTLAQRIGGWDTEKLRAITGLSTQKLNGYRALAEQPDAILDRVIDGTFPANLIIDAVQRVAQPLRADLPDVAEGRSDTQIVQALIDKRNAGNLPDVVALRDLRTMIRVATEDSTSTADADELKLAIRNVIDDPKISIEEAYQDTIQTRIAADEFEKASDRFLKAATHAVQTVLGDHDAITRLKEQLSLLIERLSALAKQLK